jgi:hypothetical protein
MSANGETNHWLDGKRRGISYYWGEDYIKNGCYLIRLTTTDRILEDWSVPTEDLSLEKLRGKLEGPLKAYKEGPFGRKFLQNKGTLTHQTRLPPM